VRLGALMARQAARLIANPAHCLEHQCNVYIKTIDMLTVVKIQIADNIKSTSWKTYLNIADTT
jgi:hypothetical protein